MAQQGFNFDQEIFSCSICLDLLNDPVTIPCGHNYCMDCINFYWDGEDQKHIYTCPQCRQMFMPRPDLQKNTVLAELVEELKKRRLQPFPDDEQHLQPQSPAFKNQKLVDSSNTLRQNICSHHNEVMKIFCRTDQQCICSLCTLGEHRGHATVAASVERTEKQKELKLVCEKIQQRIQDRDTDVKMLQQEVEAINQSADTAVRDIDKFFSQLIYFLNSMRFNVEQQIQFQQETHINRAKDLLQKLQEEITELKKQDVELKRLSQTKDDCQFLQLFPMLSGLSTTQWPRPTSRHLQYFEDVTAAVSELKDKLKSVLCEELPKLSQTVTEVDVLPKPEPTTREDFLQYSCQITLDPNTANVHMLLSEGNRKATYTSKKQSYPSHRDRFMNKSQVLSREALTGRHYWEVEWSGSGVIVAVAYKDISRKGNNSEFGSNDKSWAFRCSHKKYKLRHNLVSNPISGPLSSRVGVYVDHRAGILSFYSVSDSDIMTPLHTVQTTFSQPLHVGLRANHYIGSESSAVFSILAYSVC